MSWLFAVVAVVVLGNALVGGAGALVFFVLVAIGVGLVAVPLQRRSQRHAVEAAQAAGALWGGRVVAQPPNLGFGQSGRSLVAGFTPSYWKQVARGTLRVYAGGLVFEPRKPGPNRPRFQITPNEVVSVGAARYGYRGILEMHLRDGNRRQFQLYSGPGPLNDILRQAGFPVS